MYKQDEAEIIGIDILEPAMEMHGSPNLKSESINCEENQQTKVFERRGPASQQNCKFDGTDYPDWLGFDPFRNPEEPFNFPLPSTDGDPWERAGRLVKGHDDNMCDAWVEEIGNILIFVSD